MKTFEFKLQALLRKRELDEKELLSELIGLKKILTDELDKLEELKTLMNQMFFELRSIKKGKLSIENIQRYETFIKVLEKNIKDQQRKIIEARVAVESKNKEYIKASKKRKVVEKYKERCFKKYIFESLQEDYKFQDEFAVLRHNLKVNESF
jgi:flagellar protein FliJ